MTINRPNIDTPFENAVMRLHWQGHRPENIAVLLGVDVARVLEVLDNA